MRLNGLAVWLVFEFILVFFNIYALLKSMYLRSNANKKEDELREGGFPYWLVGSAVYLEIDQWLYTSILIMGQIAVGLALLPFIGLTLAIVLSLIYSGVGSMFVRDTLDENYNIELITYYQKKRELG